jgi:hypothetical protein
VSDNPPQARLLELFEYNEETGDLLFKPRPPEAFATYQAFKVFNSKCLGKPAGAKHAGGYLSVKVDGKSYLSHRMIWIMVHGTIPDLEVDHINGVRNDNRLANLRLADKLGNAHNQCMHADNKSGVMGVHFDSRRRRWNATASNGGQKLQISFATKEEAIACRIGIARAWEFDAGHGRPRRPEYYHPRPRSMASSHPLPKA